MEKNINDLEFEDPIGDLRRQLNMELISREKFHKLIDTIKVLPEFLQWAKKDK